MSRHWSDHLPPLIRAKRLLETCIWNSDVVAMGPWGDTFRRQGEEYALLLSALVPLSGCYQQEAGSLCVVETACKRVAARWINSTKLTEFPPPIPSLPLRAN